MGSAFCPNIWGGAEGRPDRNQRFGQERYPFADNPGVVKQVTKLFVIKQPDSLHDLGGPADIGPVSHPTEVEAHQQGNSYGFREVVVKQHTEVRFKWKPEIWCLNVIVTANSFNLLCKIFYAPPVPDVLDHGIGVNEIVRLTFQFG